MSNKIVEEMIKKAKATSIKNRGAYPVTIATNAFKQNGTPLEKVIKKLPDEEIPAADMSVDLQDPENTVTDAIVIADNNAIIAVSEGEVTSEMTLDKGITLQGVNAGIAQNFDQEV